jgi:predicted nucleic acid-binding Zn ribbon protein
MSKEQPRAIKDVVSAILEGLRNKEPSLEEKLLQEWKRVVKSNIVRHSKPITCKGSRVVINVDSSNYLYELNLQKETILIRLQERLGEDKVSEIRFRIGGIR